LAGISTIFVSFVTGLHDVVVGCLGQNIENKTNLTKFYRNIVAYLLLFIFIIFFTPLNKVLMTKIYGLSGNLVEFAFSAIPFVIVLFLVHSLAFYERAILFHKKQTSIVSLAGILDLITIVTVTPFLMAQTDISSVAIAFIALSLGRFAEVLCLYTKYRRL